MFSPKMKKNVMLLFMLAFIFFACSVKGNNVHLNTAEPQKKETQEATNTEEQTIAEIKTTPSSQLPLPGKQEKEKPKVENSYEEIKLPLYEPKKQPKPLPEKKPLDLKSLIKISDKVLVNADNMPLNEFIIYVIGETLKVTFFMEEDVMKNKTPVTLKMEQPMEPEKLLEATVGILEKRGITVEERAGSLYISTPKFQPKKPVDMRVGQDVPDSPSEIIQVFPLNYIQASTIEQLVREFFKTGVNIRLYPRENAFIIQGQASTIREVADFIKLFDVPYIQGRKVMLINLTYWQPEEFQKQIIAILDGLGLPVARMPREAGIYFIPIKYLNSLIVVCPDEKTQAVVIEWTRRLDTAESAGAEEKAFIYTPKYSKASDLADSLRNIFSAVDTTPKATAPTQPTQPQQAGQRTPQAQATKGFATAGLRVAADDKRNLLLIMTTPAQYKNILTYLEKLDQPPKQVLIEAMIAELTLADDLKYGFEWLLKNKMLEGSYTLGASFGVPASPGLTYTFLSDSQKLRVLINALATKDLVNILSSPRLMVLDNDEATIQVGTDVPVITGQVTSAEAAGTTTGVVQTIQYRSTGIILRVKPTVNTEGLLTIKISQEVSEMGSNPPGIISPTILVRKIDTSVVASSGESIILGGLMSQTESASESKVPFIGDIPLIGEFFKSRSKEQRKTELIVILTPRIISTIQEATRLTEDFKKELKWFVGNIGSSMSK